MRRFFIVIGLLGAVGCNEQFFGRPRLLHPGNAQQQEVRAERFGMFPEPDMGPPVVGASPREYAPPAEILRVQRRKDELNYTQTAPTYVPPTVVTPPCCPAQ